MAIVQYLTRLQPRALPHLPPIPLDDLQTQVRQNIYIELPQLDGSLCLITPNLNPMGDNYEERVAALLQNSPEVLNYLKERLIRAMTVEMATIETGSYFLEQNGHLLLARVKYFKELEKVLEVKLYTSTRDDLANNYSDKIYLGRCFLNLETSDLHYNGLNLYVLSLMDHYEVVRQKADGRLSHPKRYDNYFVEIHELIGDVVGEVIRSLDPAPTRLQPEQWTDEEIRRVKALYRRIVHLLLELAAEVEEFEGLLRFHREDRFARYVTKFLKDIKNIIHTLNFNVLARLTWALPWN